MKSIIIFAINKNKNKMKKRGISLVFSILFLLFIGLPTILTMVDNSIDISLIISTTTDDEESEKNLDFQVMFSNVKSNNSGIALSYSKISLLHCNKKYGKPYLDIISPPPDYYTL